MLFRQQEKNTSEGKRTADVNVTQDKPKTKVIGADSTRITDDIKSKIELQDRSPQLAANTSPRFRDQHPQEEVTILSREPSIRVK